MKTIVHRTHAATRSNAPSILAAIGVSGTISTAILAGRASFAAHDKIHEWELTHGRNPDKNERFRERFKLIWPLYAPTVVSGGFTIGCIIASTRISGRRTAAMAAAYSLSERAFSEYKDKVVEKIGERKEQSFRDEIAQDKVLRADKPQQLVLAMPGNVICCELHTMRFFSCDMETLKRAQNDINAKILNSMGSSATLDDFYDILGLDHTTNSSHLGWDSDKLMILEITTVLSADNRPCLAFEYNYLKRI